jgi:uncharacterized protein YndB with AHSA1/START domain
MTITEANEGTVAPTADGFVLRFERTLDHPIATVWDALTVDHAQWLSGEGAELELRVGGRVVMPAHTIESTVAEIDPPRVLAFGWDSPEWGPGGTVRFELIPEGERTRLVFTHDHPPIDPALQEKFAKKMNWPDEMLRAVPRTMAGWHMLLNMLEQHVDGRRVANMPSPEDPGGDWDGIFRHYLATVDFDGTIGWRPFVR